MRLTILKRPNLAFGRVVPRKPASATAGRARVTPTVAPARFGTSRAG